MKANANSISRQPTLDQLGAGRIPQATMKLSGIVDKAAVEQLFPAIVTGMAKAEKLVIDCREVDNINLDAMRTLCGIHRHVVSRGRTLVVEGLGPELLAQALADLQNFAPRTFCKIPRDNRCLWSQD